MLYEVITDNSADLIGKVTAQSPYREGDEINEGDAEAAAQASPTGQNPFTPST